MRQRKTTREVDYSSTELAYQKLLLAYNVTPFETCLHEYQITDREVCKATVLACFICMSSIHFEPLLKLLQLEDIRKKFVGFPKPDRVMHDRLSEVLSSQ